MRYQLCTFNPQTKTGHCYELRDFIEINKDIEIGDPPYNVEARLAMSILRLVNFVTSFTDETEYTKTLTEASHVILDKVRAELPLGVKLTIKPEQKAKAAA